MIIAIDGPAGSGKSTVARRVAAQMGFSYLDTGAMYRAVAFKALASGVSERDEPEVARIAREDVIEFARKEESPDGERVLIGGMDVTSAIRTPRVEDAVSAVSAHPSVRDAMVQQQRRIGSASDIVVEGRDIGTVVFPDAEVKVFLTASTEERARRRAAQHAASGVLVDPAGVRESIIRRDHLDSSRDVSPLVPAADSWALDTTGLSIDEVVSAICERAEEARA